MDQFTITTLILATILIIATIAIPLWLFNVFDVYESFNPSKDSFWTCLLNSLLGINAMNRTQVYYSYSIEVSPEGKHYIQWFYEDGTESKRSPYLHSAETAHHFALKHARMKRGLPPTPVGPSDIVKPTGTALVPVTRPYTPPAYNYPRYVAETFDEKWAKGVKKFLPDYMDETK